MKVTVSVDPGCGPACTTCYRLQLVAIATDLAKIAVEHGQLATRYADALIAIGSRFVQHPSGRIECWSCGEDVENGCDPQCPALQARRALGVA